MQSAAWGHGGWRCSHGSGGSGRCIAAGRLCHAHPPGRPLCFCVAYTQYNVVTFLPKFLWEMFSRVAYIYFLVQVRGSSI